MEIIVYLAISLSVGGLAYAGTDSMIISLTIGLICFLYLFAYARKILRNYRINVQKRHEAYHFINSFIIALSIKKTTGAALDAVKEQCQGQLLEEMRAVEHLDSLEEITYLGKYFTLPLYEMFVKIINLYLEQGRDIIEMSALLIEETREMEENMNAIESMAKRKFLNFTILWFMTAIIILFCRFAIRAFFLQMLGSTLFLAIMAVFFLFAIFSFHLMIQQCTKMGE